MSYISKDNLSHISPCIGIAYARSYYCCIGIFITYHHRKIQIGICNDNITKSTSIIIEELRSDLGIDPPSHGCLTAWAEQGVLLLNTVLTVRAHQPASHQKHGWEPFTDAVIAELSRKKEHLVYVLWGAPAQAKQPLIDPAKHTVICSAHPSPLSAHRGFFGSRPFSAVNRDLAAHGMKPIDWNLTAAGQSDDLPGLFQ